MPAPGMINGVEDLPAQPAGLLFQFSKLHDGSLLKVVGYSSGSFRTLSRSTNSVQI